jgi:hypothetical protein
MVLFSMELKRRRDFGRHLTPVGDGLDAQQDERRRRPKMHPVDGANSIRVSCAIL